MDLRKMVDSMSAIDRANRKNLRLGKMIKLLEICKKDLKVYFDFCGFYPTKPDSYRGYYSDLAMGFENESWDKAPTVADVLVWLNEALGKTYEGYKGGNYVMGENTPMWVSNWGESENTAIAGVEEKDSVVIIETVYS